MDTVLWLVDPAVVVLYFVSVIGVGFWYRRRASRSLDSYFLGGKSMHWLALSMSGAVSNFDITGTMWIVTLICLFGFKSMWNHWMWGFLMGAFFLAYMGKWVRRSNVLTGAEWMVTRFGDGPDGRAARLAYAVMAVVTLTAFVGYAFQGIGKFASVFVPLPFSPQQSAHMCAVAIFAITTLYVLLGGLYSVVATNVIQTVILTVSSLIIAGIAFVKVRPEALAQRLPGDWASLWPCWHIEPTETMRAAGYAGYEMFGALVIVWVVKGLLLNLGGPGQMYDFQVFLAARSPRDAAKVGAAWSGFLVVRWAMAMGIATLALTGLLFDPPGSADSVAAGREPVASARPESSAAKPPEIAGDELAVAELDAERVMPAVLKRFLAPGFRGLVIAGLLAAFMSTFSATVNSAASYVVRDLWQPLFARSASQQHLVRASRLATLGIVVVGTMIGLQSRAIGTIFSWIMMELGAAFVIPNVLRWYWWRLNGWGYAWGTLVGLGAALAVVPLRGSLPLYVTFPAICAASLAGCLLGTWLSHPTDTSVLTRFYRTVRPFGRWGPIARESPSASVAEPGESCRLAVVNVLLGCVVILGSYLAPMYLVGHWYRYSLGWLAASLAAAVVMVFTWYRNLPEQ